MRKRQDGFTLVEVLVTLTIVVILAMAATPMLQSLVAGQSTSAHTSELLNSLRLAHSEAIKRVQSISLCASADPDAAEPSCTTDWGTGWVLFADANADGVLDADDKVLKVHSTLGAVSSITEANDLAVVTFRPNGLIIPAAGVTTDLVFQLLVSPKGDVESDAYTSNQHVVCVSRTGRVIEHKGTTAC